MEKKLRWEDCVNCAEFTKLLLSIIAQRDLLLKTVETLAVLSWQSGRQENHKSLIFSTWESNNCCLYQGRASDYKISRDRGVEKHFNTMHWISCFDFSNPDIVQQRGVTSAAAVAAAAPGGETGSRRLNYTGPGLAALHSASASRERNTFGRIISAEICASNEGFLLSVYLNICHWYQQGSPLCWVLANCGDEWGIVATLWSGYCLSRPDFANMDIIVPV